MYGHREEKLLSQPRQSEVESLRLITSRKWPDIMNNDYAIFTYIPRLAFSMIRFDVVIDIITFMILLSSLGLCSFF